MRLIPFSLLLFASWPALAAPSGAVRAIPPHHDKRDSTLLRLPDQQDYNTASCTRASTNIFGDHGLVPQQTLPEPFRGNPKFTNGPLRVLSARSNLRMCRQIGSFKFDPAAQRLFSIQKIRLEPGSVYVLSVEANIAIQYMSAFSLAVAPPHRSWGVDAESFGNVGQLHITVDEPSDVFSLVVFQAMFARGEVALFSIGGGEIRVG